MNRTAFERRWRRDVAHAEATVLKEGSLAPLFVVVARDGKSLLLPSTFENAEEKQHATNMARLAAVSLDADLALLRCESWVVIGEPLAPGVSPASSDRRVEVVSVFASARIGDEIERRVSLREIFRGPDGRPLSLRDLPGVAGAGALKELEGEMLNLLPPRRPTRFEQGVAGSLLTVALGRKGWMLAKS